MIDAIQNLLSGRTIEVGPMAVVGFAAFCMLVGYGLYAIMRFVDDRYSITERFRQ